MSDDGQTLEAPEAPVSKRYEVEVTGRFTTYIEVDAADEDEAHDEAKSSARYVSASEWEYFDCEIESMRVMGEGEA